MRQLHHLRPRHTTVRERSHHGALPIRRRPSSQLIFDGVVAGYIHDISPHGVTGPKAFHRAPRRPVTDM